MKYIRLLVLLLLSLPGFTAFAQGISNSKLSIHLIDSYSVGSSNIVSGKPRVLKVLAFTNGFPTDMLNAMRDYKAQTPGGKVIVRVYSPKNYSRSDDATASAADFWTNHLNSSLSTLSSADKALIDYLEGPNEGETPTLGYDPGGTNRVAASQWFNQFWTNLIPKMVNAGVKPCIGSIAVGNPGNLSDLDPFIPALRQAKAAGGAWSYHAYTINYTTDVGIEIWYSLRYRQFYDYFAQNYSDLTTLPLILTEGGVDFTGDPSTSGWQARGPAASYERWLNWFDHQMAQDSYLLGCTLFQNGDPAGWSSFEIEPIAGWMKNYLTNPNDFPAAPTGVAATNIDGRVQLTWSSAPANPMTWTVKRATNSSGPYAIIASGITEGVPTTTYTDATPFYGKTSYYIISAVNAYGESADSAPVSVPPIFPAINCGGWDVSPFVSDMAYSGGDVFGTTDPVSTNGVSSPAPADVYRSQRYGNATYTISNLVANKAYLVRLHFAEIYAPFNSAGQRVFNVYVNEAKVLGNFDIWAAAGGQFKAHVQEFNAIADANGKISVRLENIVNNASLNGLEVLPVINASLPPPTPVNLTATVSSAKVVLNWAMPAITLGYGYPTSYGVSYATSAGGPFFPLTNGLTATTFNHVSYTPNTTYYYVVFASNASGASADSSAVSARPTASLPDMIVISLSWSPTNPAPGTNVLFTATIKNQGSASVPSGTVMGVGFNVDGAQVCWASVTLSTALARNASMNLTANGGGTYWNATAGNHILSANVDDINRFAEALEDNNITSVPLNVYASAYAVNSGGGATGSFRADANFSGSTNTLSVNNTIDLSGASNAAPSGVYQSERWGPSKYNFGNLVPGKIYQARLHFAEISPSVTQAGDRQFNVSINGAPALTNFDILATASAKFRAVTRSFNLAADAGGNISLLFSRGAANEPKINGIEILPSTNTAPLFSAVSYQNQTVNLTWPAILNKTYRLEYKNDLSQTNWSILGTNLTASGFSLGATNNVSGNQQRFYRIVQVD